MTTNMRIIYQLSTITLLLGLFTASGLSQDENISSFATDLLNPRGVAVLSDNRYVVIEAGDGNQTEVRTEGQGRVTLWTDYNRDGLLTDDNANTVLIDDLTSYNGLQFLGTGHDEVDGVSDIIVVDENRVFFSLGNLSFDSAVDPTLTGIGVMEVGLDASFGGFLIQRPAPINSIAFEPSTREIYLAESGLNQLSAVELNRNFRVITQFPLLASGQQAVPTGLAIDPMTHDIYVALFSGLILGDEIASFRVGDAKVVRVDPQTGEIADEIVGLTTAIDVAVDEAGNLYVVEATVLPPPGRLNREFPLTDPNAPVVHGGYTRFSGRVTMFMAQSRTAIILAENLDMPTNITYANNKLYVSTGQGTPNRPIPALDGTVTAIKGEIYVIQL